jgi:hypothetical protein
VYVQKIKININIKKYDAEGVGRHGPGHGVRTQDIVK